MSYSITAIDRDSLAEAMLDMTREQLRVDFADDDITIMRHLRWSIGYLQNFYGLQIFGADIAFVPDGGTLQAQSPVQPVASTFTAADAVGDVTIDYAMQTTGLTSPVYLVRVDGGAIPAGVTFTLRAGYEDPDDMDPAMQAGIVRVAASMYEHRESISAISLGQVPFWLNDIIGGLWVPRC